MKNQPKVFVSLVNYNGYRDTLECIQSLQMIDYQNYQIIVVDNNSTDESFSVFSERFKDDKSVILIHSNTNGGFSAGNNIAFHKAVENDADYVLLLNNDTIVEPDFLSVMMEAAKGNERAVVAPLILYNSARDLIWYAGGEFDTRTGLSHHFFWNKSVHEVSLHERRVSFISGCCCLIPISVVSKVGYMDERFFLYAEDIDYCCRISSAGYEMLFVPKAVIYHKVSASTNKSSDFSTALSTRNGLIVIDRYVSCKGFAKMLFLFRRIKRIIKHECRLAAVVKGVKMYIDRSFYE